MKTILNYFQKNPQVLAGHAVNLDKRKTIDKNTGVLMNSNDVLSMYENIAGLTNQMVVAARSGDWDRLSALENQCASAASATLVGTVPALAGNSRLHKLDLLKQILANDRAIGNITEPWMAQLARTMPAPRAHR
ncbi:flagellar protein FliT [Janthinobacterium sp. PC23-8]|uniref:flagellar protein FliT n=1 Tax=Janthinobacterium sp. PC23-8 TaxID=2012679 RepID=UPI0020CEF538|nr:flagellar protein FliT [Janthinobacterium sp. PC23-8]